MCVIPFEPWLLPHLEEDRIAVVLLGIFHRWHQQRQQQAIAAGYDPQVLPPFYWWQYWSYGDLEAALFGFAGRTRIKRALALLESKGVLVFYNRQAAKLSIEYHPEVVAAWERSPAIEAVPYPFLDYLIPPTPVEVPYGHISNRPVVQRDQFDAADPDQPDEQPVRPRADQPPPAPMMKPATNGRGGLESLGSALVRFAPDPPPTNGATTAFDPEILSRVRFSYPTPPPPQPMGREYLTDEQILALDTKPKEPIEAEVDEAESLEEKAEFLEEEVPDSAFLEQEEAPNTEEILRELLATTKALQELQAKEAATIETEPPPAPPKTPRRKPPTKLTPDHYRQLQEAWNTHGPEAWARWLDWREEYPAKARCQAIERALKDLGLTPAEFDVFLNEYWVPALRYCASDTTNRGSWLGWANRQGLTVENFLSNGKLVQFAEKGKQPIPVPTPTSSASAEISRVRQWEEELRRELLGKATTPEEKAAALARFEKWQQAQMRCLNHRAQVIDVEVQSS